MKRVSIKTDILYTNKIKCLLSITTRTFITTITTTIPFFILFYFHSFSFFSQRSFLSPTLNSVFSVLLLMEGAPMSPGFVWK